MTKTGDTQKNGCLKGCLVVVAIFIVGVIILGLFLVFKGDDILQSVLTQTKEGVTFLLTEDHSENEKAEFGGVFSDFIDDMQREGFKQGVERNQEAISTLQQIIEDKRITRHESQQWVKAYKSNQ